MVEGMTVGTGVAETAGNLVAGQNMAGQMPFQQNNPQMHQQQPESNMIASSLTQLLDVVKNNESEQPMEYAQQTLNQDSLASGLQNLQQLTENDLSKLSQND